MERGRVQEGRYGESNHFPGGRDHVGDIERIDTVCTRARRTLMLPQDYLFFFFRGPLCRSVTFTLQTLMLSFELVSPYSQYVFVMWTTALLLLLGMYERLVVNYPRPLLGQRIIIDRHRQPSRLMCSLVNESTWSGHGDSRVFVACHLFIDVSLVRL